LSKSLPIFIRNTKKWIECIKSYALDTIETNVRLEKMENNQIISSICGLFLLKGGTEETNFRANIKTIAGEITWNCISEYSERDKLKKEESSVFND
jgi:hypothetical protein